MLRVTVGFFHYHSIKIRKLDRQIKYILIEDDDRKPHTKHLYMVPCTWKSRREEKWVKLSPKTTTDSRSKTGRSYENTKKIIFCQNVHCKQKIKWTTSQMSLKKVLVMKSYLYFWIEDNFKASRTSQVSKLLKNQDFRKSFRQLKFASSSVNHLS